MFFYSRFSILLMVLYGISPSMQVNITIGERQNGDEELITYTIYKSSLESQTEYVTTIQYIGYPITYIWGFDNGFDTKYEVLKGEQNSTSYRLFMKSPPKKPIMYSVTVYGFKINPKSKGKEVSTSKN